MGKELSILMVSTHRDSLEKSLDGIIRNTKGIRTEVIVMHLYDPGTVSELKRHVKGSGITFKFHKVDMNFYYQYNWIKRYRMLCRLLKWKVFHRRVQPYRNSELACKQKGYFQGFCYVRGKYMMILPEDAVLQENFYRDCWSILKERPEVANLAGRIWQEGADPAAFFNEGEQKGSVYCRAGEGMAPYLIESQLRDMLLIVKRRRIKYLGSRLLWVDFSSDRYILDHAMVIRMNLTDSVILYTPTAFRRVTEQEIRRYRSLQTPVLRESFIKGYVWHYNVEHGYKYDPGRLKEAYGEALQQYAVIVERISRFYQENGEDETAERYRHFYHAIV